VDTRSEDWGLTRRPTLAASWDAAGGALTHSFLTRAGLRACDFDWEELLAPPAPGCAGPPGTGSLREEIASIARNMEVYLGEEYCGTSRGKNVLKHEIIFYKNYLILASSTHACKIKLRSFGERQCVFFSKVVIHMRAVSANYSTSSPALKSRIDLDRIQTIMESMGSKLSPGNCIPIEEQLHLVLGNTGYKHMIGLQCPSALGALDKSSSTPFPFRTGLPSGNVTENLQAYIDKSTQASSGENSTKLDECKIVPQNHSLLENDLKNATSPFLPKKANDSSNISNSELLPFLQNLCSQVNYLFVGHKADCFVKILRKTDIFLKCISRMEEQPILSKNMELMEKKLIDYIDQQIYKLQEHIDDKIALLMDLLQNPNSPPSGLPLRHYDSGERLSNGER
uniref:Uncharacterized protein n=1 Tax=Nomascus leucogenys TaxID=61853 RepID=G1S5A9_NOMLE